MIRHDLSLFASSCQLRHNLSDTRVMAFETNNRAPCWRHSQPRSVTMCRGNPVLWGPRYVQSGGHVAGGGKSLVS